MRIWIDRGGAGSAARATKERAEKRFEVNYRAREDILKVPDHETLRDIVRGDESRRGRAACPQAARDRPRSYPDMQARPRERVLERRERTQWDKTWVLLLITALARPRVACSASAGR